MTDDDRERAADRSALVEADHAEQRGRQVEGRGGQRVREVEATPVTIADLHASNDWRAA